MSATGRLVIEAAHELYVAVYKALEAFDEAVSRHVPFHMGSGMVGVAMNAVAAALDYAGVPFMGNVAAWREITDLGHDTAWLGQAGHGETGQDKDRPA